MPIRRFQTHSGVILHVLRPTEKDAAVLQSEYKLHPLDTAAMLEVQEEAEASRYQDNQRLQLCLPWTIDNQIVSCDLALIWNEHQAVIVHDTPDHFIAEWFRSMEQFDERTPEECVALLLLGLTERVESFGITKAPETRIAWQQNWQAMDRVLSLLPSPLPAEHEAAWRLAIHRLKHLERLTLEPLAVSPAQYADRAPRTAMRFAAASVLIFVSVLWALQ